MAISKLEHMEQVKLVKYLEILERQKKILTFFAVPNGGSRHKVEARNMKLEGVRAGVSDIVVVFYNIVLFVEMKKKPKVLKSGKLSTASINVSEEQINFISSVNLGRASAGFIAYGFDEAKEIIDKVLEYDNK
jgi:O-acetyl-ADP-ribose deacetylase (regulator of RNase III)